MKKNELIDFENSLKDIKNKISYIPENELQDTKNYLKEYVGEVVETQKVLQTVAPFYSKLKKFSSIVTVGLIGLGLIATPFAICGLVVAAFPLYFHYKEKKIESYLPTLKNHLSVVNNCINTIDSFFEEKYEVLNNCNEYKQKLNNATMTSRKYFDDNIKKNVEDGYEDDDEDDDEDDYKDDDELKL